MLPWRQQPGLPSWCDAASPVGCGEFPETGWTLQHASAAGELPAPVQSLSSSPESAKHIGHHVKVMCPASLDVCAAS